MPGSETSLVEDHLVGQPWLIKLSHHPLLYISHVHFLVLDTLDTHSSVI